MPASGFFRKPEPEPEEEELTVYVELERELTQEEQAVIDWRRKQLRRAGFKPHWADLIAANNEIDYKRAEKMLKQGAEQKTIYELLD